MPSNAQSKRSHEFVPRRREHTLPDGHQQKFALAMRALGLSPK